MKIIALAGMKVVSAEGEVDDEEIRSLIYWLHASFTDEPEKQLVADPAERDQKLKEAIAFVNREGDAHDKNFAICRLADVALADGKLLNEEAGIIIEVAEAMGISGRAAYGVIVGAAQTVGFNVDYRMKEIVREVRSRLIESVVEASGLGEGSEL